MEYTILLPGVPAYSSRGYFGWSTVALISSDEKNVLFDTGSFGDRKLLLENMKNLGITREDIDIVFLSHLHYDHSLNVGLFENARILVSQKEMDYFKSGRHKNLGDDIIPESLIKTIESRIEEVPSQKEILPGIETYGLPGHTPGTMGLVMNDVFFTGDSLKNAWDYLHREKPNPTFDDEETAITNYDKITEMAEIIVPGHDRPFKVRENGIEYLKEHSVSISHFRDPSQDKEQTLTI